MRGLLRPLLIVGLALLVPIVPFLWFGEQLEGAIEQWLNPPPAPGVIALATVGLLATDILLPIPSSVVSTVAGAQLGVLPATFVSWLGMTLGASLGFLVAKAWGRPVAGHFSSVEDLARMDNLSRHYGIWVLVVTRALPVLAEAAVLLLGATGLSWRKFLPVVMLSNLGIAAVYATLGHFARRQGELPLALVAAIAVPLLVTTIARWLLPSQFRTSQLP